MKTLIFGCLDQSICLVLTFVFTTFSVRTVIDVTFLVKTIEKVLTVVTVLSLVEQL